MTAAGGCAGRGGQGNVAVHDTDGGGHGEDSTRGVHDDYVFSPAEAMVEKWAIDAANRKTQVQPSQRLRAERRRETRLARFAASYSTASYRQAIEYAIQAARKAGQNVPHWTPYQLCHAAVTATSLTHGREVASMQAGHLSLDTTRIYDHKAQQVALDLAREHAAWWE